MDQGGAPSPSSSSRVQFPTDLTAPDAQRPAKRGLPRVGSNSRVPGSHNPRSISLDVTSTQRERTRSMESASSKYSALGTQNPMPRTPSRRVANIPSPLNPGRRTRVTHTGRREKESAPQPFDPSLYDLNNPLAQPDELDVPVPAEQLADIERLMQRRKKLSAVDRAVREAEPASASAGFRPSSRSPVPGLIVNHPTSTLASSSRSTPPILHMPHSVSSSGSTTLREATASPAPSNLTQVTQSSSTASLDHHHTSPTSSPSRRRNDSGDKWPIVFKKKSSKGKDKDKPKLTDEEFQRLEAETDANIHLFRAKASSGTRERAETAKDQLSRRYALLLPSLSTPHHFNLMNVIRWRRDVFEEPNSDEEEAEYYSPPAQRERESLSWRPHLADLHDASSTRYKSRIHAPWHLTSLLMEMYVNPPPLNMHIRGDGEIASPEASSRGASSIGSEAGDAPRVSKLDGAHPLRHSGPRPAVALSAEGYNTNRSSLDVPGRPRDLRGWHIRKSLPGRLKAPLGPNPGPGIGSGGVSSSRSAHQSKSSLSALFGINAGSEGRLNRFLEGLKPARVGDSSGEEVGEGWLSGRQSPRLWKGYYSGGDVRNSPSRTTTRSPDQAAVDLATTDEEKLYRRSRESSIKGSGTVPRNGSATKSPVGKSKPQKGLTILPYRLKTHGIVVDDVFWEPSAQAEEEDDHEAREEGRRTYGHELAYVDAEHSTVRRRLRHSAPIAPARNADEEASERKRIEAEEKWLERFYEKKEQTCDQLDALDRNLRGRLRGLLAVSRDYNNYARRLHKVLSLDDSMFEILGDDKLRAIMGDQTQIWNRARRLRNLDAPQWLERLERQQVAVDVYNDLQKGRYLISLNAEIWTQREDLEDDLRRAKGVLDKARFTREAANRQLEKEQEMKNTWARLFSEPNGRVTKLALEAKKVGDMIADGNRQIALSTEGAPRVRLYDIRTALLRSLFFILGMINWLFFLFDLVRDPFGKRAQATDEPPRSRRKYFDTEDMKVGGYEPQALPPGFFRGKFRAWTGQWFSIQGIVYAAHIIPVLLRAIGWWTTSFGNFVGMLVAVCLGWYIFKSDTLKYGFQTLKDAVRWLSMPSGTPRAR